MLDPQGRFKHYVLIHINIILRATPSAAGPFWLLAVAILDDKDTDLLCGRGERYLSAEDLAFL